jgi:hypothetical protein
MKIVTPRPSTVSYKTSKVSNNNNSPSYGIVTTLRRIESLLLSTAEDVSNINDTLNCHIDSTNKQCLNVAELETGVLTFNARLASLTASICPTSESRLMCTQDTFNPFDKLSISVQSSLFLTSFRQFLIILETKQYQK